MASFGLMRTIPTASTGRVAEPCPSTSGRCPLAAPHQRPARRCVAAFARSPEHGYSVSENSRGSGLVSRGQRDGRSVVPQAAAAPVSFDQPQDIKGNDGVAVAATPAVDKVGVLLLNLGGPESLDDVQPFLYNLFADPEIIRLPQGLQFVQPILAQIISVLRAPKSSEGYKAIGGGSPLRKITDEQAVALEAALKAKGQPASVYVGMRYWHPYTEEALEQIKRDGVTRLVILPLYPQFSISTSGSSLRLLESLFKSDLALKQLKHTVIPSWYQRRGYVSAMADLIVQVRAAQTLA